MDMFITPTDRGLQDAAAHRFDGTIGIMDAMHTLTDATQDAGHVADMTAVVDAIPTVDSGMSVIDAEPALPPAFDDRIATILDEYGLSMMRIRIAEWEVLGQQERFPGVVDFDAALRAALESFLLDGDDVESPRSLAQDFPTEPCLMEDITERVRCHLNRPTSYFELYGQEGFPPENGESIDRYWVFILRAESLSDHIQWALVDRQGEGPTFNYGFN